MIIIREARINQRVIKNFLEKIMIIKMVKRIIIKTIKQVKMMNQLANVMVLEKMLIKAIKNQIQLTHPIIPTVNGKFNQSLLKHNT